jgi:signal peptidase II
MVGSEFILSKTRAWPGLEIWRGMGKDVVTLFRLIAVVFGVFYIRNILKKNYSEGSWFVLR